MELFSKSDRTFFACFLVQLLFSSFIISSASNTILFQESLKMTLSAGEGCTYKFRDE